MRLINNTANKSTLARLLAKENITVTHGNMRTAYFDVKNRVLGLPTWKDRGQDVTDMLIGHEVGHALYTPQTAIEDFRSECGNIPFDVCNIVEDIRIERMIKDTYPGLPRVFKKAYTILVENDFFSLAGKDIASLKFIDRLNLRGKIGDIANIPLDPDEELIYQKCLAAETFQDVLDICKEITSDKNDQPEDASQPESEEGEESTDSEDSEGEDSTDSEDSDGEDSDGEDSTDENNDSDSDSESSDAEASSDEIKSDDNAEASGDDTEGSGDSNLNGEQAGDDFVSETLQDFEDSIEKDVEMPSENGYMPVILPRRAYVYDKLISYKELAADRGDAIQNIDSNAKRMKVEYPDMTFLDGAAFSTALIAIKKKTSKKVGILVREFERRKASFQYSRSQESRTGVIDTAKLHSYKLTDEIFLSKSIIADAKSHGMIFLIDYSGSMSSVLEDVIEQTLNLVEFCKKVGIPFDVYSFTNAYHTSYDGEITPTINEIDLSDVILIHQLSSSMSKSVYTEATNNLWAQYWLKSVGYSRTVVCSKYERLGGTPLDAVLTMMYTIVKDFIAKHNVQKTMFVTLTDGDSNRVNVKSDSLGLMKSNLRVQLGNSTALVNSYRGTEDFTKLIGTIPTVTTLGFFLPCSMQSLSYKFRTSVASGFVSRSSEKYKKAVKDHKRDGFVEFLDTQGYDSYFILSPDLKIEDEEFTYESNDSIATSKKAQSALAKEFSKHHIESKKSRVLMGRIAMKVA